MNARPQRVAWFAGTRYEAIAVGSLFRHAPRARTEKETSHEFVFTGEQGVAAYQAMDYLGLCPHEEGELRAPSEDTAIRLQGLMETVEQVMRRNRITHAICSGFGPTAAAVALVAHARPCKALWLRPHDPIGFNEAMRWEAGLERIIRAASETSVVQLPALCRLVSSTGESNIMDRESNSLGLRADAPLAMISVGRQLWGAQGVLNSLVEAVAKWAKNAPQADFLLVRSMDARLEGPYKSMPDRPENFLASAPLPFNVFGALIRRANIIVTDSPHIVADCVDLNRNVIALGERAIAPHECGNVFTISPGELGSPKLPEYIEALRNIANDKATHGVSENLASYTYAAVQRWLDEK